MSLIVLLTTAGSLGLLGGLPCVAMCAALQRVAVHGTGAQSASARGDAPLARTIPLHPVGAVGHQVLLGEKLDAVGERL